MADLFITKLLNLNWNLYLNILLSIYFWTFVFYLGYNSGKNILRQLKKIKYYLS